MAETNAPPTDAEIKDIRFDVDNYLISTQTLADYAGSALAQFKNDIEDKRGYKFTQVFDDTNDLYFTDTDSYTRNLNKIRKQMLCYLAVAFVFRDYAIATAEETDSRWWDLYNVYRAEYDDMLKNAQLDIDLDEDGAIEEGEERTTGQRFFSK